jgi:thiol-disulfide isomerase/thioredoxin
MNRRSGLLLLLLFPLFGLAAMIVILLANANQPDDSDLSSGVLPQSTPAPIITTRVPTSYPTVEPRPIIDAPPPEIEITDLDGKPFLLQDLKGQVVVVNFWATWCEPCVTEMPTLKQFAEDNPDVLVLGVTNPEDGQTMDEIRKFIADFELEELSFGLDKNGMLRINFNAFAMPISFIIDADGIVRARHIGELKPEDLDFYMEEVRSS